MRLSLFLAAGLASALLAGCAAAPPRDQIVRQIDPEMLVGLAPEALTARLGEPGLRRQEQTVEVWQYRSDTCVLDLYLDSADDADDTGRRVVYYEARRRSEGEVPPSLCLGEIMATAVQAPTG